MNAKHDSKANKKPALSIKAADKIWRDFRKQPAQITGEQVDRMEKKAQEETGLARRIALQSLTQSGKELSEAMRDRETAVAFADAIRVIESYERRLKAMAELMHTASIRLGIAMSARRDMQQIMRAAQ